MITISYALRDERVNTIAMTAGDNPNTIYNQVMLCKKRSFPLNRKGPFLLDPKKSAPVHKLSDIGQAFEKISNNISFEHRFVAYVDCEIEINVNEDVFKDLFRNGLFPLWEPEAPYKYYAGQKNGFISIFRVYQISENIDQSLLEKGRLGRNYYYRLEKDVQIDILNPVISESVFREIKHNIIDIVEEHDCLVSIQNSNVETIN